MDYFELAKTLVRLEGERVMSREQEEAISHRNERIIALQEELSTLRNSYHQIEARLRGQLNEARQELSFCLMFLNTTTNNGDAQRRRDHVRALLTKLDQG